MSKIINEIKLIYKAAVEAVKPEALVSKAVKCSGNQIQIQDGESLELNGNCHVIGFGKAVLEMALQLDQMIGQHIKKGIVSIPKGLVSQYTLSSQFISRYTIYEGASNNIPDEDAAVATYHIEKMVSSLTENDILFVLISGGGSALLVSPINDISLEEKQKTIQLLSKNGANIQELNSVRKKLSRLKGGKLARLSRANPTIALVLSDVIGNPLDVIASGPTVENKDPDDQGWKIIQKYHLENQLPDRVSQYLRSTQTSNGLNDGHDSTSSDIENYLIGSNMTALEAAENHAKNSGFTTAIISDRIQGEAKEVGKHFAQLARVIAQMMTDSTSDQHEHIDALSTAAESLGMDPRHCCKLERLIRGCQRNRKGLCLIGGGETTVKVQGTGIGGRNQEMVLSFLIDSAQDANSSELDTVFLSGGTDGLDGPTNAAGAIAIQNLFREAQLQGLDPHEYLNNNDSFHFFQRLHQGSYHIVTGPSGTNVMDIQVLYFNFR